MYQQPNSIIGGFTMCRVDCLRSREVGEFVYLFISVCYVVIEMGRR